MSRSSLLRLPALQTIESGLPTSVGCFRAQDLEVSWQAELGQEGTFVATPRRPSFCRYGNVDSESSNHLAQGHLGRKWSSHYCEFQAEAQSRVGSEAFPLGPGL